ncbi:MFS transporter [Dactylosporangium sp. CA-139114]|uniref:MFS transporter n=1 Tax=Dactylosporangium sp. CA-139114 TaxID=3239931 RepID=UPI003D99937F
MTSSPGTTDRPPGGLLRWHRDFRLFWIGETTSQLGTSVSRIALPLVAITTLHASTVQIGALAATTWLPWLLIGLPAGALVDRLPARPLMVVCNIVSIVSFAGVAVAAWLDVLTMAQLFTVALVAGTAGVFFETAYQIYLRDLLERDLLPEGNAKLQGSAAAAGVAGPGLGGIIAQAFGAVLGLLLDTVTFVVSTICLLASRPGHRRADGARRTGGLLRAIGEGLRLVARDPYLRTFTVYGAASNLALNAYQALLVVFLVRDLGVATGTAGLVIAAMTLGGVAGAALATRVVRRFGTGFGVLVCQLGVPFALLIPLAGPGARLAFPVVGGVALSAAIVSANVIKGSWRQSYCPGAILGRVTVTAQFLNYGTIPLGALIGGALGTALGVRPTIWIGVGALTLCGLILLTGPLRRHRDLPEHPEPVAVAAGGG